MGGEGEGICRTRERVGVREEPCIGFDFPAPTISGAVLCPGDQ